MTLLVNNKKAYRRYEIKEKLQAGLVLKGTEVKSLRAGHAELRDSYIVIGDDLEVWVKNMTIPHYSHGNIQNHEEKRNRKLLLKKREIIKLFNSVQKKSMSIVPLYIFLKGHLLKMTIGIGKGRKTFEKKEFLKERDLKRDTDRYLKIGTRK
ncbi:SsrA-binding protein SmpB [Candidatus Riflebacteria bacterium]